MLLLLEAGLSVDIGMMKQLGAKAVFVAFTGSFIPIGMGMGFGFILGYDFSASLTIGCILAPTSTGIAIEVFKSMNAMQSPTGQLVTTAAVIDDVISLIVLAELQALSGESSLWDYIRPVISSLLFVTVLGTLSVWIPGYLSQYPGSPLQHIPFKYHKSILLTFVMFYGVGLSAACNYAYSSHLLGCFLAGLGFCRVKMLEEHWEEHVGPILKWLLKAFFAGTVAFSVPHYTVFADPNVIAVGFLMLVPVIGKILTGFFASPLKLINFFKVGFAMAAWGEIAFLIATTGYEAGLLPDEEIYASMVFAVLVSALFSPFILRFLLVQERKQKARQQEKESKEKKIHEAVYWSLVITCQPQWSLFDSIAKLADKLNLDVVEAKLQTDHNTGRVTDRIILRETQPNTPADRKQRLKEAFTKCVTDPKAELTLYRWYSDTEVAPSTEEFVHIDPDQFSSDDDPDEDDNVLVQPKGDDAENERVLGGIGGGEGGGANSGQFPADLTERLLQPHINYASAEKEKLLTAWDDKSYGTN